MRPIAVLLECYGIDVVCEMTPSNHMLSTMYRIGIGLKQGSARAKRCRVALSARGVCVHGRHVSSCALTVKHMNNRGGDIDPRIAISITRDISKNGVYTLIPLYHPLIQHSSR